MARENLGNNAQQTLGKNGSMNYSTNGPMNYGNNGSTNYCRKWPYKLLATMAQQTTDNNKRIIPKANKLRNKLNYLLQSCSMDYLEEVYSLTNTISLGLLQHYSIIAQYYLSYKAKDIRVKSGIKPKRKKIYNKKVLLYCQIRPPPLP